MPPLELLEALHQRPFRPFAMHVSDGTVHEVKHPELVMVSPESLLIGVPAPQPLAPGLPPLVLRRHIVDLNHVVRLVPLELPVAGNGA